jgi:hypothetical protein
MGLVRNTRMGVELESTSAVSGARRNSTRTAGQARCDRSVAF